MKPDVVVVGAGLAGLSAAVRLAEAGASVRVLAKGVGSTHLGAGTIDVLGYDADGRRVDRPLEALGGLPAEHPYRLVGRAGVSAAIEWFKGRIADGPRAPYAYVGDAEQNVLLPTAVGAVAPAGVVPETMVGGDLRGGGRVCVVGFRGLKDFFPALVADNLSRGPDGVTARGVELDLRPEGRADPNALAYARAFDDEGFRAEVVAQLVARVAPDELVAFPAVLGLVSPHEVWAEMEHRFGRAVFEIPTLPPSVPGIRRTSPLANRSPSTRPVNDEDRPSVRASSSLVQTSNGSRLRVRKIALRASVSARSSWSSNIGSSPTVRLRAECPPTAWEPTRVAGEGSPAVGRTFISTMPFVVQL